MTDLTPGAPAIGQVWADMDPRGGSVFRIVNIVGDHAVVTDLHGNRRRRIQLKRLRPGKRGYRLARES